MEGFVMDITSPILLEKPRELLNTFIEEYSDICDIDKNKTLEYVKTGDKIEELIIKWYAHLDKKDIDKAYSVYDDDYYFLDLWECFKTYSRGYLRDLHKPTLEDGNSILELTKDAKHIVDIGCGIAYTTIALKQMYTNAKVYGINLENTKQWKFCEKKAIQYDFELLGSINNINKDVDIIFASEYFEHILKPVDHLKEIINILSPKYFIIANSFNRRSIGHFREYHVTTEPLNIETLENEENLNKIFNRSLVNFGYEKVKTKFFNNRPNIWTKRS